MHESAWPALPVLWTRYLGTLDTGPLRFHWWRMTSIRSSFIWSISWFYDASSFTAHIQTKSPQAHRPERNRSQTLSRVVCESKVAWIKLYGESHISKIVNSKSGRLLDESFRWEAIHAIHASPLASTLVVLSQLWRGRLSIPEGDQIPAHWALISTGPMIKAVTVCAYAFSEGVLYNDTRAYSYFSTPIGQLLIPCLVFDFIMIWKTKYFVDMLSFQPTLWIQFKKHWNGPVWWLSLRRPSHHQQT